jgi:hypothetical protein
MCPWAMNILGGGLPRRRMMQKLLNIDETRNQISATLLKNVTALHFIAVV